MGMVSLGNGIMFLNVHCFHISLCHTFLSACVSEVYISVTRIKLDWQRNYAEYSTGMQGTKELKSMSVKSWVIVLTMWKYSMQLWLLPDHTKTVLYFSVHHFQTLMKFSQLHICCCLFLFEKQDICWTVYKACCIIICLKTAPLSLYLYLLREITGTKHQEKQCLSCVCPSMQCLRKNHKDWRWYLVVWTKLNIADSNIDWRLNIAGSNIDWPKYMFCCAKLCNAMCWHEAAL
jgi:hypothetical protein